MKRIIAILIFSILSISAVSVEAAPAHHRAVKHKPVKVLPKTHHRIIHRGKPYYFANGRFYTHKNGVYVSISAPLGAIIPSLPNGYMTVGVGPNQYFHFGGIYYRRSPAGYVVIERPAESVVIETSDQTSGHDSSTPLMVYPTAGQSEDQRSRDKYECHTWASGETGFDPTNSSSDPMLRDDYQRAMSACLEAHDYIVK